ncbi:nucleoplasmin-like protein [Glossina fuscipes]|uniref:Nucleoplasmin-like protein n=1 Tax=Glossina fuscipes TaxID=7396 RepID=A0A9C5ZJB5_9MUSC|nr:nucleoplasmin-like protein [Glossina fuscipes]
MPEESFYEVTLAAENSAASWDVPLNSEDYPRGQKLVIRQVLLGAKAKEYEFIVVEVCRNIDGKQVLCDPSLLMLF